MAGLSLGLGFGVQRPAAAGQAGTTIPANALTLNGQPLTLNGNYLVLGA